MTETKIMGAALTILAGIISLTIGLEYSGQWQQRWADLAAITGIIAIFVGICWLATTIRDYLAYEASLVLMRDLITQTRHRVGNYERFAASDGGACARGLAEGADDILQCLLDYEASLLRYGRLLASFHGSELKLLEEKEAR